MKIARRITIREVARLSDVSVGTVSNVLNGASNVSEATRRRVERVIDDLGFTPDTVARSLIARRKRTAATGNRTQQYAEMIAREGLPQPDQVTVGLLAQIVDEGALGATRHVHLAHRVLIHMAQLLPKGKEGWRAVRVTADFIAATRGADIPLVANGVAWLIEGIDTVPPSKRANRLAGRAELWLAEASGRLERLINVAMAVLGAGCRPVLLDYSGTVAAIVEALHQRGLAPAPIVLENRGVAGGVRYVNQFLARGIDLQLAPDAAIEHVLGKASAVLIGCESMRCDGSVVNSLGSRPLARIAQALDVPVYCCADLFKLDIRSYAGSFGLSTGRSYDLPWIDEIVVPEGRRVEATAPAVEIVPARFITSFITEEGPVPPQALWRLGRDLFGDRIAASGHTDRA